MHITAVLKKVMLYKRENSYVGLHLHTNKNQKITHYLITWGMH